MNAENKWYSPLMFVREKVSQECFLFFFFSFKVLFYATVKALGLQVRSMHGAVPRCAAREGCECNTHTHKHTFTLFALSVNVLKLNQVIIFIVNYDSQYLLH